MTSLLIKWINRIIRGNKERKILVLENLKMVVGIHRRAVGVFANRRDAEEALHELRKSGFDMNRVSVVVQDADGDKNIAGAEVTERVGDKSDEGATVGAVSGGTLGGLTGLLVGLGTLAIPGIGPIMLAGATATALATTLAGVGIGALAGSLLGGLIGLGIPEERARVYNDRVQRGQYLVILDGSDAEIAEAGKILHTGGIEEFGIYNHPGVPNRDVGVRKYAVGYFSNLNNAESAINDLRIAGFPLSQISLVHQNSSRRDAFAGIDLRDRFDQNRWHLPGDRHRFYNEIIDQGQYVIVVDGTDDEINHAAAILNLHGIQQWQVFDPELSPRADLYPNPTGIPTPVSKAPLHRKRAIGVFSDRRIAEAAITDLRDGGISMDQVSIIGKNAEHNVGGVRLNDRVDDTKADDGAKAGAVTGGALGGLGGLLVGLGTLAIPGVGPVLLGGAAATALATALTGGAIGAAAGSLAGALVGLGIPEKNAKIYNDRINRGDYLVIVDGTDAEVHRAEEILKNKHVEDFNIYDATDLDRNGDRSVVTQPTPILNTTQTNYVAPTLDSNEPSVIIVDRRNEPVL
jgi:hypothetical protein